MLPLPFRQFQVSVFVKFGTKFGGLQFVLDKEKFESKKGDDEDKDEYNAVFTRMWGRP
jgi:hypothetical protein